MQKLKIKKIPALIVLSIFIILWVVYRLTIYGPVYLTIKPDDFEKYDDFILLYGAGTYRSHGGDVLYSKKIIVSNKEEIVIKKKIWAFLPSHFFVTVCHPLYGCNHNTVQWKDVNGAIDFGQLVMYSKMQKIVEGKNKIYRLGKFSSLFTDIKRNYMPHIREANHHINISYYARKLAEMCDVVHRDAKTEIVAERCRLSKFESFLMTGVVSPGIFDR